MAKLSELKKVELLEAAVMANDAAAVAALFAEYGSFEFTARALGMACRMGTEDLVRVLCENGATFLYNPTAALVKKYDCKVYVNNYDWFARNYRWMVIAGPGDKTSEPAASGDQRRKNLEVLFEYPNKIRINKQELLYIAMLQQDEDIALALREQGVDTLPSYRADLAAGRLPHNKLDAVGRYDRKLFSDAFRRKPAVLADFIVKFYDILGSKPLHLFKSDVLDYDFQKGKDVLNSQLCCKEVFSTMIQCTDFAEVVKKQEILYALVDQGNAEGLDFAIQQGWVAEKDKKNLLKYAQSQEHISPEVMALLLDQSKGEKKDKDFSLELEPPTAAQLKELWGTKKLPDGSLMITSYKGEDSDVIIPDRIGKNIVTMLGSDVFNPDMPRITPMQEKARRNIRSVVIPGTISVVAENLFSNGSGKKLHRVVLNDGVRCIDNAAFYDCGVLAEVVLPPSLATIGNNAFSSCKNLEVLEIPDGVTKVGYGAFYGCKKLADEEGFLIMKDTLYGYYGSDKEIVLSAGVKHIAGYGFGGGRMLSVVIPDGTQTVGENAFMGCGKLKETLLPQSITTIGTRAFADCVSLETITIPTGVRKLEAHTFAGCKKLRDIHLPETVDIIEKYVFGRYEDWMENLTIHAPAGSYAEQYAKESNIPFVAE